VILDFFQLPLPERVAHYAARRAFNLDEDAISGETTSDPLLLSVPASEALRLIMAGEEHFLPTRRAERARRVALDLADLRPTYKFSGAFAAEYEPPFPCRR
jgi:hypothetical protein